MAGTDASVAKTDGEGRSGGRKGALMCLGYSSAIDDGADLHIGGNGRQLWQAHAAADAAALFGACHSSRFTANGTQPMLTVLRLQPATAITGAPHLSADGAANVAALGRWSEERQAVRSRHITHIHRAKA